MLPVHEFQTIGVGSYLADYLLARIYPRGAIYNAKTEEVARAAVFVLNQVKSSIQGCDGETHIIVFSGIDGTSRVMIGEEVHEIEQEFDQLDIIQRDVFRAIARPEMSRDEFEKKISEFETRLRNLSNRQRLMLEIRSKIIEEYQQRREAARPPARKLGDRNRPRGKRQETKPRRPQDP